MDFLHFLPEHANNHVKEFFIQVYNRFGFYRHQFSRCGIQPDDAPQLILDRLPVLTPEEYIAAKGEILNDVSRQRFLTDLSTGTTGQRKTRFVTSKDDEAEALLCERFFKHCGISAEDRILALDIDCADIYLFYGQVLQELGVRDFVFGSVPWDFSESVAALLRLEPTTLLTIPSLLRRLLPQIKDELNRGRLHALERIIYLGETMPCRFRMQLEQEMGLEVFSFYGSTEIGSVAGECMTHNGIHIYNDAVIPTLVRPTCVGRYQTGEITWTTVHFRDHPVVKYTTRDYVSLSTDPCRCGLPGPRLHSVRRMQDEFMLYGHKFYYEAFANSLNQVSPDADFLQIEVEDLGDQVHVTFRLPSHLKCKKSAVDVALQGTNDLAYFVELKFLTYELKFDQDRIDNGRKLRRVVDQRRQWGTKVQPTF